MNLFGIFCNKLLSARINVQTSFRREIRSITDRTNLSNCDFFHVLYLAILFSYICGNWIALYLLLEAQVSFSYLQTLEFCSCILTVILSIQFFTFYKVHWSTFEALKCNEIKNYERKLQSGVCHDCTAAWRRKSWIFIYSYLFNKSDGQNIVNECYCLLHLLSPNRSTNKMKENWLWLARKMTWKQAYLVETLHKIQGLGYRRVF